MAMNFLRVRVFADVISCEVRPPREAGKDPFWSLQFLDQSEGTPGRANVGEAYAIQAKGKELPVLKRGDQVHLVGVVSGSERGGFTLRVLEIQPAAAGGK